MSALEHFRGKRHCYYSLQTFCAILTLYRESKVVRQVSVMSILGSTSAVKELPRTLKNIFDSKLTF